MSNLKIIDGKKPLDHSEIEKARIGEECYFSDDLDAFEYLDEFKPVLREGKESVNMYKGNLLGIFDDGAPFLVSNDLSERFTYCLPVRYVQPDSGYRPYTLKEFQDAFKVGRPIRFRHKSDCARYYSVFNGYIYFNDNRDDTVLILLGDIRVSLDKLFVLYEYKDPEKDGWLPFGVETNNEETE